MRLSKEYSFWSMAKNYGLVKIFINWDFILATIFSALVCYFYLPSLIFSDDGFNVILALIGANAGLMGIVLAGFSIFIAFMDKEFLPILRKSKLYEETIFMFTYSSMLISIALFSSIMFAFSNHIHTNVTKVIFILSIFFTFYGLLSIILLFIQVKNIAIAKGRYISMREGELTSKDF